MNSYTLYMTVKSNTNQAANNRVVQDGQLRVCVQIGLTLPVGLLNEADSLAERDFCKRSDVIRLALLRYVRGETGYQEAPAVKGYDEQGNWHDSQLEELLQEFNQKNAS